MQRAIAILIVTAFLSSQAHALPAVVMKEHAGLSKRGEAVMRFFGIKVYDIRLWALGKAHDFKEMYALELVYDLGMKGNEIARRSVEEMRKVGYVDEAKLTRWGEVMAQIFPDVQQGDTLVGVSLPGKEVRFYSQEKLIATVPDAEFAKAFFEIWLSPKTSEPRLRERLLGLK